MQIAQPSVETFNCLLDVTDAHRLAKLKDLDKFLLEAAKLARAYETGVEVGCFILHRHDDLKEGEVMARSTRTNHANQLGIVTRPEKFAALAEPIPVSFRFALTDSGEYEIIPLEYSNCDLYASAGLRILEQKAFLEQIAKLIFDHEMEEIFGITLVSGSETQDPTSMYVEEFAVRNGVRENIVYVGQCAEYREDDMIPTTWRLIGTRDPQNPEKEDPNKVNPAKGPKPDYICVRACVPRSPGHSIEHQQCNNWA